MRDRESTAVEIYLAWSAIDHRPPPTAEEFAEVERLIEQHPDLADEPSPEDIEQVRETSRLHDAALTDAEVIRIAKVARVLMVFKTMEIAQGRREVAMDN